MPQLDLLSFSSQIFWLIVIFFSLYIFSLKFILPSFLFIKRMRLKRIYLADPSYFKNKVTQRIKSITRLAYKIRILKYLKKIKYRKKIYEGAMRHLQRGLSFRSRVQLFRHNWALNLRRSIIKSSPFISVLFINDTVILFFSFFLFFLSIYVYTSNLQIHAFNDKRNELKHLFSLGKISKQKDLNNHKKKIALFKNYRHHVLSSIGAFGSIVGSTIPSYSSTYSFIISEVVHAQPEIRLKESSDKKLAKVLFPKMEDIYTND